MWIGKYYVLIADESNEGYSKYLFWKTAFVIPSGYLKRYKDFIGFISNN